MNFELKTLELASALDEKCDALVVLISASFKPGKDALSPLIGQAIKGADLEMKAGKLLQMYRPSGSGAVRVVLACTGDGSTGQVRKAVHAAVTSLKGAKSVKKMVLCFTDKAAGPLVEASIVAAADASYVYTATKSTPQPRTLQTVLVAVADPTGLQLAVDRARATVLGIELAREWGNRPANHATPSHLAQAAKALAKLPSVKCEILGRKHVEKLGMGSFLGVAQGSAEDLKFIVLQYRGAAAAQAPVVLVGKGITFDTGGISIKPAAEMDEMKFDMCGAASVLGVFRSLAELKPALNVVGLIPACENMPDGTALKPGDVVTSMSGQTIEVLNTDAEGRLVLCDALTYAERFKPVAVIDIATLTGACVVALGGVRSGMFSTDDSLAKQLWEAGESSADLCWRMPLDDDYADGLKTNFADVANVAGRAGGAVTAAKFLQRFATKFPWAHLDIAGTAWKSGAAKGATGRPVGLLLDYLLGQATRAAESGRPSPALPAAKPTKAVKPPKATKAVAQAPLAN